jgi:NNP family nitrate/nitrite transporter-like MFS transporter
MTDRAKAISVLTANTFAFTICFAAWTMNGVLATFLVDQGVFRWSESQLGWLIGIPVLTGSLVRLPIGILTDKYGGRPVYFILLLLTALPMYAVSWVRTYEDLLLASLGFGLSGGAFAVGIAYTSVWFPKHQQGTALGIFGAGNAGSAVTSMGAPALLMWLTDQGRDIEAWRMLPKVYAAALVVTAIIFWFLTYPKVVDTSHISTFRERLAPLGNMRVWRFGYYYFLVFGCFVGLSQWLVPYYVNVYTMPVVTAGLMASIFSLPSGVIRALGGWMSDYFGARRVMYWILGTCTVACLLLIVPRMDIESPGRGVMALRGGTVTAVSAEEIVVGETRYAVRPKPADYDPSGREGHLVFPAGAFWQEPAVAVGETVSKRQLLARGVTHVYFQANVWVFTFLVFVVGFAMGIGKAAVYRHIPDYFPRDVGVVGGLVGVIGGLGGFVCPILFGWMLQRTGIWTTAWMLLALLSISCLVWMHLVIQRMMREKQPALMRQLDSHEHHPAPADASVVPPLVPQHP